MSLHPDVSKQLNTLSCIPGDWIMKGAAYQYEAKSSYISPHF